MKLVIGGSAATAKVDVLAVGVFAGERRVASNMGKAVSKALDKLVASSGFSGKEGKAAALPAPKGVTARTVLLVGLGRPGRDIREATRRAAGTSLGKASDVAARSLAFAPPSDEPGVTEAAAEGFLLADYEFARHKTAAAPKGREVAVTIGASDAAKARARQALPVLRAVTDGVKLARDLGNEPSNVLTPTRLAEEASRIAAERKADGMRCKVLGPAQIAELGMGAFLGVARGSSEEPRFIHMSWKPKGKSAARVVLVGKGLCFDSGGISIKPAASMEDMKFDMCGAAAVIGLFSALPALNLPLEVHGLVAATDNMPSGSAVKPGDILVSMAGRTIEVINTDAEGRLTLVDAITYGLQLEPDYIVDMATLTGACAVALGPASGVMSNDDALRDALCRSSDAAGERSWPLPLYDDYKTQLKSDYADVKNLGDRYGGALTAGLFIKEWVPDEVPWAHVDIAGSAWGDRETPYCTKGATGVFVRTLAHWLTGLR